MSDIPIPPKLAKADKSNFRTLLRAGMARDLALLSAVRKADGKPVALVCAMGFDGEYYRPTPLAVMVEGNPFELFYDPTAIEPQQEKGKE